MAHTIIEHGLGATRCMRRIQPRSCIRLRLHGKGGVKSLDLHVSIADRRFALISVPPSLQSKLSGTVNSWKTQIYKLILMDFAPFDVRRLVEEITRCGDVLSDGFDEAARQRCLVAARSLTSALETPLDSILRLNYAEVIPRPSEVSARTLKTEDFILYSLPINPLYVLV